ncbi:MAG: UDP-N-acetylmuramate--L-alanine ligase [Patescibacteria group bacterium]|nr:UDP-N-acetylmuramate--L-alanine ligase [Patescibacteria group bacterium]
MLEVDWHKSKKVYFVGIGGIGVSAIARMFRGLGKEVEGCNEGQSEITDSLVEEGVKVDIGQDLGLVPRDADLIVYSNAIKVADPGLLEGIKALGAPLLSYPEILGLISRDYEVIAVAGTHGKTTTTAMLAKIMIEAGLDPTVVVGTLLLDDSSEKRTNFVAGGGKYLLLEADEYQRAFLNFSPSLLIITNIDLDHLDYYKDLADIQSAFVELAQKVSADGFIICDAHNPTLAPIIAASKVKIIDYPSLGSAAADSKLALKVPGKHNLENARAALVAAEALGVGLSVALKAVNKFTGAWRRFEFRGIMKSGALVYDDYAHNPQKVRAALQGAREAFPDKKIIAVFQPHLYSRIKSLFADFVASFNDADEVIVTNIYAAREKPDPTISGASLAEAVSQTGKQICHLADFGQIASRLERDTGEGDVVILLGAGDISQLADDLLS